MKTEIPGAAAALLASLPTDVQEFALSICRTLVKEFGSKLYVKTIYVGVEINGAMVAALYPAADRVDIALALEEEHPSAMLEDATHLTWPSLPVLVSVGAETDQAQVLALIREAAIRIVNSEHHVSRSPEYLQSRILSRSQTEALS